MASYSNTKKNPVFDYNQSKKELKGKYDKKKAKNMITPIENEVKYRNMMKKALEMRKDLERTDNMLKKIKNPFLLEDGETNEPTEAQRRKEAQDKALGDQTTDKKGLGRVVEKIKTRNDLVSYGYKKDSGVTTTVVTRKKKIRKEQRKIDKANKPKMNLPEINLPQISFEKKPKPKYFKRRNMMAKNQVIRK